MMTLKKNTTGVLSGMILTFLFMALSGCGYSEIARKDSLNTPMYQTKNINPVPVIVYGISFESLNTVLRIKKFRIQYLDNNMIKVNHGLSYALEYNEISSAAKMELKMILKRHHFDSQKQFTIAYSSVESILPNSNFKPVPKNMGQELFFLAQKNNQNDHEPLLWPLLN